MRQEDIRRLQLVATCFSLLFVAAPALRGQQTAPAVAPGGAGAAQAAEAPVSAKLWVGKSQEIEEFIRTAPPVKMTDVPIGVAKPKRAYFAPNSPVESINWKKIPPGNHGGHWDSYKGDIAGYELDKLLEMNMVPPTVERRLEGDLGAAILWVKPTRMFKDMQADIPKVPNPAAWDKEVIRMKMFDNLIHNPDRNAGNILIDPMWNIILIDHSRAFVDNQELPFKLTRVDAALWEKMKALTFASLDGRLGPWLGKREINAILKRRDKMQKEIDALVAKNGEANVFLK
jgi:hypothetical protein